VISHVSYYFLLASSGYHFRFQFAFYSILSHPWYWYPAAIGKYKPQDATTNPSLILAASKKPEYAKLIDVAIEYGKSHGKDIDEKTDAALDRLLVEFGKEILKIVPGKVSTEVDARFSFDTKGSVEKALHIIEVINRSTHKWT
jgi:transaldolase